MLLGDLSPAIWASRAFETFPGSSENGPSETLKCDHHDCIHIKPSARLFAEAVNVTLFALVACVYPCVHCSRNFVWFVFTFTPVVIFRTRKRLDIRP